MAEKIPAGKAMTRATRKAQPTSCSRHGRSAPRINVMAGFLETHDVPKFPASTFLQPT